MGLFKPDAASAPVMLPRTWDAATLLRSIPWMRWQNRNGRNIYVRPKGEHNLSLVDDLTANAVTAMKREFRTLAAYQDGSPAVFTALQHYPLRSRGHCLIGSVVEVFTS